MVIIGFDAWTMTHGVTLSSQEMRRADPNPNIDHGDHARDGINKQSGAVDVMSASPTKGWGSDANHLQLGLMHKLVL